MIADARHDVCAITVFGGLVFHEETTTPACVFTRALRRNFTFKSDHSVGTVAVVG